MDSTARFAQIIKEHEASLLAEWAKEQTAESTIRKELIRESELREQCRVFLSVFQKALQTTHGGSVSGPEWNEVRSVLTELSRSRSEQGFTPSETATFVFSLKKPLFLKVRKELAASPEAVIDMIWTATNVLDSLGLFTTEAYQKSREGVIQRQQQELLELSTPVVKLFEGILALPLIGTLDSRRTQIVMESLLQAIVDTGSDIAIIDITGVPTVDTLVAQHLIKTVAAARLMGAECIISGIRPQIAQTIVHLAIDLGQVTTKASLSDALQIALRRRGYGVVKN